MSWFPWKKSDKPAGDAAPGGNDFQPQPDKARRWFDHGRTMAASSNYVYALTCFASGIKLDPTDMSAHEAMWEAAVQFHTRGGKPATGKECRQIDGPQPVDRFAAAEFAWMRDINNATRAIEAMEAAGKAGQSDFGQWAAPKVRNILFKQKKLTKAALVRAKDAFAEVGAWNEAFQCGEAATKLDPTDNGLLAELKELTAQRAIAQGGYAQNVGGEGGFRANVRDAEKQRELDDQESISSGADAQARNLTRAKEAYEANTLSPEAVTKYVSLLKRDPEHEELAHEILMKAFEEIGEYRFRAAAGDLRIAQRRRAMKSALALARKSPDDEELKAAAEDARLELLRLESDEFGERAEKYPTDRTIRFELGRLLYEQGRYEEAMPAFQATKEELRLRVASAHLLGKCFAAEGWHQEAIAEFNEAIHNLDATDKERELEIRYDLMLSLLEASRAEQSVALAKEAADICSAIVRRDITFRDIRARRKEVDELIKSLGGPI